jgi:5'-3' exonuclease
MNVFIRHFAVNEAVATTGELCGGVVGFLKALYGLVAQFAPERIYVVWEQGGGCPRRKKIFPEYKANRMKTQSDFKSINLPPNGVPSKRWIVDDSVNKLKQVKMLVDAIKNLPICQIYVADTECDDVIGHLVRYKLKSVPALKIIVSSDRDFYQLLDEPNVKIFNPADKSFHDGPIVKVKVSKDEFVEVPARNYVLVRTMTGDASDNIPGVPGMGFKTAIKLFPSLSGGSSDHTIQGLIEAAKARLGQKKPPKVCGSVVACEDLIRRNWQLMYLSSGTLAPYQINKIEYAVDNFEPKMNKLGLIKTLLSSGVVTNINFDDMAYQMQISLITS